jgi:Signal transduction histidine kinase
MCSIHKFKRKAGVFLIYTLLKGKFKIKNTFLKSLRFRILIILILIGIIPNAVIKWGVLSTYRSNAVNNRIVQLRSQSDILLNQISESEYMSNQNSEVIDASIALLANMYNGRILLIDKQFKVIKDTYGLEVGKTTIASGVVGCFDGKDSTSYNEKEKYIELNMAIRDPITKERIGVVVITTSTNSILETSVLLSQKSFVLQVLIGVGVCVIAFYLSKVLVRPFQRVTKSIEELTDGYMDVNISILDFTETQLISEAFNKVLARMKVLDDSRQEFVSNVSHELKTPLTSMKVLADSLIMQDGEVPVELYKEFMTDIAEEIDRENTIINDLLSLVKMDKKSLDLNIKSVDVNELIELILKRLRPIAGKQNIELVVESFRPVTAELDEVKITLALSNLVENAIKYNKKDGWVHVSLNADHKYFYVKVADSGMGIPEESIEHIFERFYRVDKSHSREIGGTGLGLAIARNAILMHRGAIKVYSKEEEGTTFTVRVPLSYVV